MPDDDRRSAALSRIRHADDQLPDDTLQACQVTLERISAALRPFAEPIYKTTGEELSDAGFVQLKDASEEIFRAYRELEEKELDAAYAAQRPPEEPDAIGDYVFHAITLGWLVHEAIAAHVTHPEDGPFRDAGYRVRCIRELVDWFGKQSPEVGGCRNS